MKNKINNIKQYIYILLYIYYLKKNIKITKKCNKISQKLSLGNLVKMANKYGYDKVQ